MRLKNKEVHAREKCAAEKQTMCAAENQVVCSSGKPENRVGLQVLCARGKPRKTRPKNEVLCANGNLEIHTKNCDSTVSLLD